MKLLVDNGDEHIGGDGGPRLRLHGVLGSAEEAFDAQVLLNPEHTTCQRLLYKAAMAIDDKENSRRRSRNMETDFPTASAGSSQAPTAAVEKSHSASHTEILTLPQLDEKARRLLGHST